MNDTIVTLTPDDGAITMLPDFSIKLAQTLIESTDEFPVDLDIAFSWCGYSDKRRAKDVVEAYMAYGIDFTTFCQKGTGGRPSEKVMLTVDGFKQLAMLARSDQGQVVRKYFLECERIAKQKPKELTRLEILKLATEAEEGRILAEAKNQALEAEKAKNAPLVAFAEKVAIAVNEISFADMAKILGTGRNRLFAQLRELGVIQKKGAIPYQRYLDDGWFVVTEFTKECSTQVRAFPTARVTGKGQIKIAELLGKQVKGDGIIHLGEVG